VLRSVAKESGFSLDADIKRHLQDSKKSFNPKIGKIKGRKHILIFKNKGDADE
jgi:hypothetical protein